MIEMEPKKRIEIVVERSLLEIFRDVIDDAGAKGYTIVPCLAGKGRHGEWSTGDPSPAFDRVYFLVITSDAIADQVLERLSRYLSRYSAVVSVSDTLVIRGELF